MKRVEGEMPAAGVNAGTLGRRRSARTILFQHPGFVAGEALLLALFVLLTLAVLAHPGPLPGDYGLELDFQHWLRPHHTITSAIDAATTITWPIPSAIIVASVFVVLLVLRRWLDALVVILLPALSNGSAYLINALIHRPRPAGHGLYVAQHLTVSFSYPSGHVIQAVVFYGFLVFLTFQIRHPMPWLWLLRLLFLVLIGVMGPSRIAEGEHWPSDVLAALLYGAFWLILAIHFYVWAGVRWPRLRGRASLHPLTEHVMRVG
jgi:membrane-associated phospholipid phosphatase